ncbi:hypothetical protein GGR51DRAFT_90018 [Nemania sp. FL0031]|nr:hypothetical protein GGR51DRAFT_90018 [Nemania sp. FL0031]
MSPNQSMGDTVQDSDYSLPEDEYPEGTFDLFSDVNFSENVDSDFESRLGEDFPVEENPAPPSPYALEPVDEQPSFQPPDFSNDTYLQQPQFGDPTLPTDPAQPHMPPDYNATADLNIDWSGIPPPDFSNMMMPGQIFPPNNSLDAQFTGQPVIQQPSFFPQQPMGIPFFTGHQPQPNHGYQVGWQPPQLPIQHPMAQPMLQPAPQPMVPPVPQVFPQPIPPPMPQPLTRSPPQWMTQSFQPGVKRSPPAAELIKDSDLPAPLDPRRHSKYPPSPGIVTTSPPIKRPATNHHGEPLLNDHIPRRTHGKRAEHIEPERYYGPPPAKPKDWGPVDERGRHLFTYNDKGELAAGLFLTPRQMRMYLVGPGPLDKKFEMPARLPGVKGSSTKWRQGLTLWIGWPAAMANSRYPRSGESTKCRFASCQYRSTISLGDPWVIFDERQNVDGEHIDPFHNAGYVHLFCLEYHFDIVELWHNVDIRPDYRSFKRESHPYFCLGYKLPGIDDRLQLWWINAYKAWELARGLGQKRPRSHDTSLAQCLIEYKLLHEPKGLTKNRQKRGGVDMSKHRGDPELKAKLTTFRRFGLLDDNGWPVPDADAKLEVVQAMAKEKKKADKAAYLQLLQSWDRNKGQQSHPQVQEPIVDLTNTSPPLYSTQPEKPATDLPHLNQPMTPASTTPATGIAGSKRSREETATEDANIDASLEAKPEMPPPKRQRLGKDEPAPTQPSPETPPASNLVDTAVPPGDTGIADIQDVEMQDGLPEYNAEKKTWATADFEGLSVNEIVHKLDNELDAHEGREPDSGGLASVASEHAEIKTAEGKAVDQASDSEKSIGSSESPLGKRKRSDSPNRPRARRQRRR